MLHIKNGSPLQKEDKHRCIFLIAMCYLIIFKVYEIEIFSISNFAITLLLTFLPFIRLLSLQ